MDRQSQNWEKRRHEGVGDEAQEHRPEAGAATVTADPPEDGDPADDATAAMTWSVTPVADVALIVPNSMPHRTRRRRQQPTRAESG